MCGSGPQFSRLRRAVGGGLAPPHPPGGAFKTKTCDVIPLSLVRRGPRSRPSAAAHLSKLRRTQPPAGRSVPASARKCRAAEQVEKTRVAFSRSFTGTCKLFVIGRGRAIGAEWGLARSPAGGGGGLKFVRNQLNARSAPKNFACGANGGGLAPPHPPCGAFFTKRHFSQTLYLSLESLVTPFLVY